MWMKPDTKEKLVFSVLHLNETFETFTKISWIFHWKFQSSKISWNFPSVGGRNNLAVPYYQAGNDYMRVEAYTTRWLELDFIGISYIRCGFFCVLVYRQSISAALSWAESSSATEHPAAPVSSQVAAGSAQHRWQTARAGRCSEHRTNNAV